MLVTHDTRFSEGAGDRVQHCNAAIVKVYTADILCKRERMLNPGVISDALRDFVLRSNIKKQRFEFEFKLQLTFQFASFRSAGSFVHQALYIIAEDAFVSKDSVHIDVVVFVGVFLSQY